MHRSAAELPLLDPRDAVTADEVLQGVDRSTVFMTPSEREPWGNILASAVALTIPSAVTRSAALASLVEAFAAGRIVADGDHLALLGGVHNLVRKERHHAASEGALRMCAEMLNPDALRLRLLAVVREVSGRQSVS